MSQIHILYVIDVSNKFFCNAIDVSKTSFVRYDYFWRRLLYVMDVSKMSFLCFGCLKDIFCMLWMSQRRLLYVMNVSKTSFVCFKCLKDIFCMLWMSQRRLSYVLDVSKMSFSFAWRLFSGNKSWVIFRYLKQKCLRNHIEVSEK